MCHQTTMIQTLAARLEADAGKVQLFETHISWVLVSADFAYKFKKALRLEYLDYSTIQARHFYCKEELRLNRRLAPELYLDVVAITGSEDCPQIDGDGSTLDYAVKMRAFPQASLWDYRLRHRLLRRSPTRSPICSPPIQR